MPGTIVMEKNGCATRAASRALARLRPLAAALALAAASSELGAVTRVRPGEMPGTDSAVREDGTRLRTALRAWHLDALNNPGSPAPNATTRSVTNCDDDGDGSLRAVIAASASGDTVDLSALRCSRISLDTGAVAVRLDSVTLIGPPSRALVIDGNDLDRVFLHYGYGGFLLRDLTVRNGRNRATGTHLGIGGCIASAGYLTLDHSTVTACYAGGEGAYGGAIYAYSLILSSSTLSHNSAYGVHVDALDVAAFGGAAFVYQLDVVDSTITRNAAHHQLRALRSGYDFGGGISTVRGGLIINSTIDSNFSYGRGGGVATFADILVRNSTISGNSAPTTGGGGLFIRYPAMLEARNSTVTDNTGRSGGGILFTSQAASLQSTIVSGNHGGSGADVDGSRPVSIDGANNLVGTASFQVTLPAGTLRGDAELMPLSYNGGPTRTHALRPGSAAIDAGNNTSQLPSDQRGPGFLRVVGPAADIGAFELGAGGQDGGRIPVPAVSNGAAALLFTLLAFLGLRTMRRRRTGRSDG